MIIQIREEAYKKIVEVLRDDPQVRNIGGLAKELLNALFPEQKVMSHEPPRELSESTTR